MTVNAPLTRADLWSLEEYAERRQQFRRQVMEHKQHRRVAISEHISLVFEDRLTIQYQIQEMLRVERIFEAAGIEEELEAYNPLIPDDRNWKATLMIEYPDVDQRRRMLAQLRRLEHTVWTRIQGHDKVYAIANEDLERSNEDKTAAVHFLRFELSPAMCLAVKGGANFGFGVDHELVAASCEPVPEPIRAALAADIR